MWPEKQFLDDYTGRRNRLSHDGKVKVKPDGGKNNYGKIDPKLYGLCPSAEAG